MNTRLNWLLLPLLALSAGCLDNVALADRSDGGTSDSPPAVCAACGGTSSASCLYAPGCGSPQRVCAVNTCADAAAGLFCGCDGQTFASGCLTPDRPYAYANACGDGGTPPDAPTVDASATDAPSLPYCPAEVDYNAGQNPDLRYRRAAFALPPDSGARLDPGDTVDVTGSWAGTRTLATPIVVGCEATDPRPECRASTVIRVRAESGVVHEFVVTTPEADLTALTLGMAVVLRAGANRWDGAAPLRYIASLVVLRASDNRLMLGLSTGPDLFSPLPEPAFVGDPVCRSRPEPLCHRVLMAFDVHVGTTRVLPGQSAVITNSVGRYQFSNRVAYRRVLSGGPECSDVTPSVFSVEVVRQPDA